MNNLTLFFGPSIPDDLDTVGLAFIAAPQLTRDTAVAVLAADRYVAANYAHLDSLNLYTATSAVSGLLTFNFSGTDMSLLIAPGGGFSHTRTFSLKSEERLTFNALSSPIRLQGLYTSPADSWQPIIEGGVVWRSHVVDNKEALSSLAIASSGQPSWLIRSGLRPGDEVYLIYTLPEVKYGQRTTYTGQVFPGSGTHYNLTYEIATIAAPNQLKFVGDLVAIRQIVLNGVVKAGPGVIDGVSTTSSFIKEINRPLKLITLNQDLSPDDFVVLEYYSFSNSYIYSGYRDFTDTWYTLNCNPEYGHVSATPALGRINSSNLLQQAATIYMIPTAYLKIEKNSVPSANYIEINCSFVTAYNWGETHFVRHIEGLTNEAVTSRQQDGPSNTWGHAVFGRNYYDENPSLSSDIFSDRLPSMLPLGKIILAAPAASKAVSIADIRQRGGGIPEDFPFEAINTNSDGLDTLRAYLDCGIWQGAAIKEGGILEVLIDTSVLDNFTADEVYRIVSSQVSPGIDLVITYQDSV